MNSKRWADYFDFDLVVYVFFENDFGDHIKQIKRAKYLPFAVLTDNGFRIDNSFRDNRFRQTVYFKWYYYLRTRSVLFRTVVERAKLLLKYGMKNQVGKEDRDKPMKSKSHRAPNPEDLLSTWPDSWREYAKKVGAAIISKWQDELKQQSRKFVILYIPRASEMGKEAKDQDSWKAWLEAFCKKQNIAFVDPAANLLGLSGRDVFFDHFTQAGHRKFSAVFVEWFTENAPDFPGSRPGI